MNSSVTMLDTAKKKFLDGEESLCAAYYARAREEGVPGCLVELHEMTRGYLVYPLDYYSGSRYFEALLELKLLAERDNSYIEEYRRALGSLNNILKLFLREVSLYYFSQLAVCYNNSLIVTRIHELLAYLCSNLDNIAVNDCYGLGTYLGIANLSVLRTDLLKVKAYCLRILLTYTAAQGSAYTGTTYNAYTFSYGCFSDTTVTSHDNYTTWAVIKPRLNMIGAEAYYDDYLALLNQTEAEIKRYTNFDGAKELRECLTTLVDRKKPKTQDEKEFDLYAKLFEKSDPHQQSLFKMLNDFSNKFNPFYRFTAAKSNKKLTGMGEIGSFELDTYFTRKKLFGVCDMISCATHISIETVRFLTLILSILGGIGVIAYVALIFAMKTGFYLPGITVVKH